MFITTCPYVNREGNTEIVSISSENIVSFSAGKNVNAGKKTVLAHLKNGRTVPLCLCNDLDEAQSFISDLLYAIKDGYNTKLEVPEAQSSIHVPAVFNVTVRYDEISCEYLLWKIRRVLSNEEEDDE